MANRYATKSGNWSDVTVWDGGTTLPTTGDTVRPNTFTVTIDQSVTVTELRHDASAPAAAGGTFNVTATGFTITANVTGANSATLLTFSAASPATLAIAGNVSAVASSGVASVVTVSNTGTLTITGNVTGTNSGTGVLVISAAGVVNMTGNVVGASGSNAASNPDTIRITGVAMLNVTGNVTASSISGSTQVSINNASTGTVNVTGNVTGGGNGHGSSQYAIVNNAGGTINVTGTVTGGTNAAAIANLSTGSVVITGDLVPSSAVSAVVAGINVYTGANTTTGTVKVIGNIQSQSNGHAGYGNGSLLIDASATMYHAYRVSVGGAERKLYTGGTNLGQPVAGDVRYATVFGASNEFTGSLRVPAAQYVSQGVLVDNTTGTLTASSPDLLKSTTIATLASQTSFTLTAGSASDNAYKGARAVITKADGTNTAFGVVSAYTGASKTITLLADPGIYTMAVNDSINLIAQTINFSQILPASPDANSVGEALFLADILGGRINTAQAGAASSITLDAGASTTDNRYNGYFVYLYGGTGGGIRGVGQQRTVIAYNGTTKVATVDSAWGTNPDNTTKYMLLPHPEVLVAPSGIVAASFGANAITSTAAPNLDVAVSTRGIGDATAASQTTILAKLLRYFQLALRKDTAVATDLATELAALNANTGTGVGAYDNAADSLTTLGDKTSTTNSTLGTAGAGLTNLGDTRIAHLDRDISAILTTALTQSYATAGSAPTAAQVLFILQQMLAGNFSITGTTITVYKLDGSTVAATFTLNDASSPTAMSRAT